MTPALIDLFMSNFLIIFILLNFSKEDANMCSVVHEKWTEVSRDFWFILTQCIKYWSASLF